MDLVFLGTPPFAVPTLEALIAAGHHVKAVYTQPDRPSGRGQELSQSAVKKAALAHNLPVLQPERVRLPEEIAKLAEFRVPVMVVVGYGQILPQAVIDLAPLGIINVHGSLLPKYRGAAPIQWAIANGESHTGVTTMRINAGMDTGDMLLKAEMEIQPDDTSTTLAGRLSLLGAELLIETLKGLETGTIAPIPQDHSEATYAAILKKEDGRIDFSRTAGEIANRLRGFTPWPGAYTTFRGTQWKILSARPTVDTVVGTAGEVRPIGKRVFLICGNDTLLEVIELQQDGRKRITAEAFLNGQRPVGGETFGGK